MLRLVMLAALTLSTGPAYAKKSCTDQPKDKCFELEVVV
jgi:hypothetical protein